jgi:hypothetical protein
LEKSQIKDEARELVLKYTRYDRTDDEVLIDVVAELLEKIEKSKADYDKMFWNKNEIISKAKEIIENIIRVTWGEGWNYSLDWKVKAEQFLKEVSE